MGRRKKFRPPFEMFVERLGERGVGVGRCEELTVQVRGAAPGTTIEVQAGRTRRGVMNGRKLRLVDGGEGGVEPRCAVFGLCGGCTLQEIDLQHQRVAKREHVEGLFDLEGVRCHGISGAEAPWEYRNKFELTFGTKRYLSEEEMASGAPMGGRFVGFHAPGRFDRIVESPRCELMPEGLRKIVAVVKEWLATSALKPWDVHTHEGFWRHLVLRETTTGERLVALYTAEPPEGAVEELRGLAEALPGVDGVLWYVNPRVADAAIGDLREVLRGRDWIEERLLGLTFRLSSTAFFQTNTPAAEVLYEVIRHAAVAVDPPERPNRTLLDLYCGTGSIGLSLARDFEKIVGVEINEEAVVDARANAERNGVENASFFAGAVREVAMELSAEVVVVDPPRAGLHPKVAQWLPRLPEVERIVYVACKPGSLARDREFLEAAGWRMTDLWCVDLFPQTGHVEAVGLFQRV